MRLFFFGESHSIKKVAEIFRSRKVEIVDDLMSCDVLVTDELVDGELFGKLVVDLSLLKDVSVPFYRGKTSHLLSLIVFLYKEPALSKVLVLSESTDGERERLFLDVLRSEGMLLERIGWEEYGELLKKLAISFCAGSLVDDSMLGASVFPFVCSKGIKERLWELGRHALKDLPETPKEPVYADRALLWGEFGKLALEPSNLFEMRQKIRVIDFLILDLLKERVDLAKKIALEKKREDSPIDLPDVEEEKMKELLDRSSLIPTRVRNIFEEIMRLAKEEEYRVLKISKTVAVLGPAGSFSDEMAVKLVGSRIPLRYCNTTDEIIKAVESGETDYGIVPIENSTYGTVLPVLDALLSHEVEVFGESKLEVVHCLAAKRKMDLKEIKRVYSHPQAISQCLGFLNNYLPHADIRYTSSTSDAVRLLDDESAAILSENAARLHGLFVLRKGIQDLKDKNITRFYLIRKKTGKMEGRFTSLFFGVKDRPGALKAVLDVFASRGINLRKLESRPARTFLGDYIFFVEVEAPLGEEDLGELDKVTTFYKVIGVFDEVEELSVYE